MGTAPAASAAVTPSPLPFPLCVQNNFLSEVREATLEKAEAAITEDVVLACVV